MTWWQWLLAGGGTFVAVSVAVSLAVAATLGRVSRDLSELLETEAWMRAPLTRERTRDDRQEPAAARGDRAEQPTAKS